MFDFFIFLGLWEKINNANFNRDEFDTIKIESARNQINDITR